MASMRPVTPVTPVAPDTPRRLVQLALVFTAGLGLLVGIQVAVIHLGTDPLADVRHRLRHGARTAAAVVIPNVLPPKCASAAMEADARCHG